MRNETFCILKAPAGEIAHNRGRIPAVESPSCLCTKEPEVRFWVRAAPIERESSCCFQHIYIGQA